MESSWSYVSGRKGFVSDEIISSSENFARRKMPWWVGDKTSYTFGNNMLISGQHAIQNQGFKELVYQEITGKELSNDSVRDALSSKVDRGKIINPSIVTPNAFSREDESTSRLASSIVDSTGRDSSFIDLKLGRFSDLRDAPSSRIAKGTPLASSSESSTPQKRVRAGVNSHNAFCQVYGCNKDLSTSKEYHKRHKVCEVHSKTAKVIVNGIEQRFCQQCSRFHLLAEFDDGKRSCRKRLAGHNERRRKPQVGNHAGRSSRPLQPYNAYTGGRFHGTALTSTSFICQDILPRSLLHPEKYGTNDWCTHVKVEDGTDFSQLSTIPGTSGLLHSKSLFPPANFDKVFPTIPENGPNTATGSIFSESTHRYPHILGGPNSGSHSLLRDNSLENEDFTTFDAASTIQRFSSITESGCALSLLSSQSRNSSNHSSAIPIAHPLVEPTSNTHYNMSQVSDRLIGLSSQACTSSLADKLCSSGISSVEGSHLGPMLLSDGSGAVNFGIADGIYQGSHYVSIKDRLTCEDGNTINLLQLSSQLQRVECEKHSLQLKQENSGFCSPSII